MNESAQVSFHLFCYDVHIFIFCFVERLLNIDKLNDIFMLKKL